MNVSQNELKKAYQLVTKDLFNKLVKAKDNQTVFIGSRGAFGSLKKTEHQMTCHMKNSKAYGNTYVFYKVKFSMSNELRNELSRSLEKKYK